MADNPNIIIDDAQNEYEKSNAITLQSSQLIRWAKVLNEKAQAKLEAYCISANEKARTAAGIPRGNALALYVNLMKDGFDNETF